MNYLGKYGEANTFQFVLHSPDGVHLKTGAIYAAGDVKIVKDGGAAANTSNGFISNALGYSITLTALEMTAAKITLAIVDQGVEQWLARDLEIMTIGHTSARFPFIGVNPWLDNLASYAVGTAGYLLKLISTKAALIGKTITIESVFNHKTLELFLTTYDTYGIGEAAGIIRLPSRFSDIDLRDAERIEFTVELDGPNITISSEDADDPFDATAADEVEMTVNATVFAALDGGRYPYDVTAYFEDESSRTFLRGELVIYNRLRTP